MRTEPVKDRAKRLVGRRAALGWAALGLAWLWRAAEAVSTLDFLTRRLRFVIGLISSHPTLTVTVACALYLSAVVVWPRGASSLPQPNPSQGTLRVDSVVVQECMLGSGYEIRSGSAFKVLLVDFFNDPAAKNCGPLLFLSAKVAFYDQDGNAYASLPTAHWRTAGKGPDFLAPGKSASLVLAITDHTDAAFAVEEKNEAGMWHASRVNLKSGPATALVRVTHIVDGQVQTQEYRLGLLLKANPKLKLLESAVSAPAVPSRG